MKIASAIVPPSSDVSAAASATEHTASEAFVPHTLSPPGSLAPSPAPTLPVPHPPEEPMSVSLSLWRTISKGERGGPLEEFVLVLCN